MISFLNTRAVLAVRNLNIEEGVKFYNQALAGSDPMDALIQAKVLFNQGLAYVRNNQLLLAEAALQKSLDLGGSQFNRAAKPLSIAKQIIQKQSKLQVSDGGSASAMASSRAAMDEFEFETVF